MCLKDAAETYGINRVTLADRIDKLGWDADRAVTTPIIPREKRVYGAERYLP